MAAFALMETDVHPESVGASASKTVTQNVQSTDCPLEAVALCTTAVVPTGNVEPLAGPPARDMTTPRQLSVAVGALYVTGIPQVPEAALNAKSEGHVEKEGTVTSLTVTVKEHVVGLFAASTAA